MSLRCRRAAAVLHRRPRRHLMLHGIGSDKSVPARVADALAAVAGWRRDAARPLACRPVARPAPSRTSGDSSMPPGARPSADGASTMA